MVRFFGAAVLAGAFWIAVPQFSAAQAAPSQSPAPKSDAPQAAPANPSSLPPAPAGKSTILGGEIRSVDAVRDMLTLKVYGQKPVKIFFDERTQVFQDGKKMSLHDLRPADHAAVQTILDGTDIFAISIHMLSHSPEGDYQGTVMSYNPETTELTISSVLSRTPMKLYVPNGIPVTRAGQQAFTAGQNGMSDLMRGALVSVKFQADKAGRGVANEISILATPGADFVFIGNLTTLDTHAGELVLVDPRNDQSYQIAFNATLLPVTQNLHVGDHIIVKAKFNEGRYLATEITPN